MTVWVTCPQVLSTNRIQDDMIYIYIYYNICSMQMMWYSIIHGVFAIVFQHPGLGKLGLSNLAPVGVNLFTVAYWSADWQPEFEKRSNHQN